MNNSILDAALVQTLWEQAEKDPEDYRIALSLAQGYADYREKLVIEFALIIHKRLSERLQQEQNNNKLLGYYVDSEDDLKNSVLRHYYMIGIHNDPEHVSIGMATDKNGANDWYFGIEIHEKNRKDARYSEEMREMLRRTLCDRCLNHGKAVWWFWWSFFAESKYRYWSEPESMHAMVQDVRGDKCDKPYADFYVNAIFDCALSFDGFTP